MSRNKGVNQCSKDVKQTQQRRPESPMVPHSWHVNKYKVHKLHQRYSLKWFSKSTHLVEFMYLVFTCTPGKSYCRQLRSLLCLFDVVQALMNSLVDSAQALWVTFCLSYCMAVFPDVNDPLIVCHGRWLLVSLRWLYCNYFVVVVSLPVLNNPEIRSDLSRFCCSSGEISCRPTKKNW